MGHKIYVKWHYRTGPAPAKDFISCLCIYDKIVWPTTCLDGLRFFRQIFWTNIIRRQLQFLKKVPFNRFWLGLELAHQIQKKTKSLYFSAFLKRMLLLSECLVMVYGKHLLNGKSFEGFMGPYMSKDSELPPGQVLCHKGCLLQLFVV